MELPVEILIHNTLVGLKGAQGTLLAISPHGYYEVNVRFGDKTHRVQLPIAETVVIRRTPEEAEVGEPIEVQR